jgi:hypothetical protein
MYKIKRYCEQVHLCYIVALQHQGKSAKQGLLASRGRKWTLLIPYSTL